MDKSLFINEQSFHHFEEIAEIIRLQIVRDGVSKLKSIDSIILGNDIPVIPEIIQLALVYEELETRYPLEALTLLENIVSRQRYTKLTETSIKIIFKEIVNQKKKFEEKQEFRKKIVWSKNRNI